MPANAPAHACRVKKYCTTNIGMDLKHIVKVLEERAPLHLAESWDNVGLLVEPSPPHFVRKVMLTNDLTESVLTEAVREQVNMIYSYHPPIFVPLKRLTQSIVKERIIIRCLEHRIAVYSPHTVYDALEDGVNNWLADAFARRCIQCKKPISGKFGNAHHCQGGYRLEMTVDPKDSKQLEEDLKSETKSEMSVQLFSQSDSPGRLSFNCAEPGLTRAVDLISKKYSSYLNKTEIFQLQKPPLPNTGMGLWFKIEDPMMMQDAVESVKVHCDIPHVRLALGAGQTMESFVKTVAVCAGSGSSILRGTKADLYVTGEMSHHDILDVTSKGINLILCEHSNSERGFLKRLKKQFMEKFSSANVEIIISQEDRDPLTVA